MLDPFTLKSHIIFLRDGQLLVFLHGTDFQWMQGSYTGTSSGFVGSDLWVKLPDVSFPTAGDFFNAIDFWGEVFNMETDVCETSPQKATPLKMFHIVGCIISGS